MAKRTPGSRRVTAHAPNTPKTFCIEFVLDETGSMGMIHGPTVGGFNDYLDEQRVQPGECKISLTKFESGRLYTPFEDLDIALAPTMTDRMFCPGGGTNLFDAIGDRIESLDERLQKWSEKPNVLFVVMTDGQDNQSRYFDEDMIFRLVTEHREAGWAFAYLGADQNALEIGKRLGFRKDEIKSFASAEMRETMRDLATATTVFRTAAATGTHTAIFAK